MRIARKLFSDLPISKKLVVLLWIFILIVTGLLGLSYLTIENLSAARAYVGGEGLWSKAQKQAIYELLQYSMSRSEADYEKYQESLLVPLGDKAARLELEKPYPDMSVVRQGFIQGRNNPHDVEGMTKLFRRFRNSRYMSEAVMIWTKGDRSIERLQELGNELHAEVSSGRPDAHKISEIAQEIDRVGSELTPLEDRFSYALGEGARQAKNAFLFVTFGATVFSLSAGLLLTLLMLRHVRQTEERYKHLINTANDSILVIDAEAGRILAANDQTGRLLDRPLRDIVGRRSEEIVAESDRPEYLKALQTACNGGSISGRQFHLRVSEGISVPVEVNAGLTEFDGKKIIQGIFRDITQRQRLEEEVRHAQKIEVVGRLAGGIAHDFNNLLMIITSQTAKLTAAFSRAELSQRAEIIRAASDRAASLTKQLLEFGRKQVLDLRVLNLNDLLAEVKDILSNFPANHVQVVLMPDSRPLPVKVDGGKIGQVIMNLGLNAIDAMSSGGTLTIKTCCVTKVCDQLTDSSRLYALLEVIDTGHGMTSEIKAHIFEPFFTTKPADKGTGLGLSIVYGIVKQSGGLIEVDSSPGQGATFRVYLPIVDEPLQWSRESRASSGYVSGSETVLLAEDQDSIRSELRQILEASGYSVLEARGGGVALEVAEQYSGVIDVLVTDVVMPRLQGIDLAKRISTLYPDIRVIFMSGYSERILLENQLLNERSMALIQKPFSPEDLPGKVRECLMEKSVTIH